MRAALVDGMRATVRDCRRERWVVVEREGVVVVVRTDREGSAAQALSGGSGTADGTGQARRQNDEPRRRTDNPAVGLSPVAAIQHRTGLEQPLVRRILHSKVEAIIAAGEMVRPDTRRRSVQQQQSHGLENTMCCGSVVEVWWSTSGRPRGQDSATQREPWISSRRRLGCSRAPVSNSARHGQPNNRTWGSLKSEVFL